MLFSIITVNYNNADGLRKTINSVIMQGFTDYEFIIIDGASTDGSVSIIREYASYITDWVSEPDRGIYHAMNKGILKSKGDYLLFLNSGDFFREDDILLKVSEKKMHEDIICGATYYKGAVKYSPNEVTLEHFCNGSMFHQSSFIRRDFHLNFLYDESLKICADVKFFIETLIIHSCSYRSIDLVVSEYEGGGISETNFMLLENEKKIIWEALIPKRIREDYIKIYKESFRRLSFKIEKSNFKRLIYFMNICTIKCLKLFNNTHWIHNFKLRNQ